MLRFNFRQFLFIALLFFRTTELLGDAHHCSYFYKGKESHLELPVPKRVKALDIKLYKELELVTSPQSWRLYYRGMPGIDPKTFDPAFLDEAGVLYATYAANKGYAEGFFNGSEYGSTPPSIAEAKKLLKSGVKYWGLLLEYKLPESAFDQTESAIDGRILYNDFLFLNSAMTYSLEKIAAGEDVHSSINKLTARELFDLVVSNPESTKFPLELSRHPSHQKKSKKSPDSEIRKESILAISVFKDTLRDSGSGQPVYFFIITYKNELGKLQIQVIHAPTDWYKLSSVGKEDIPQPLSWRDDYTSSRFLVKEKAKRGKINWVQAGTKAELPIGFRWNEFSSHVYSFRVSDDFVNLKIIKRNGKIYLERKD